MEGTLPDGLAFDRDGNLFVVTYRPDAVWVVAAGSSHAELYVEDREGWLLAGPTNVAFAADGARLLVANIGRWHISELAVPRPGLPLHYPREVGRGYAVEGS